MMPIRSLLVSLLLTSTSNVFAFQPSAARSCRTSTTMNSHSSSNNNDDENAPTASTSSRRAMLQSVLGAVVIGATTTSVPTPAEAKYSDYTRREKDWQERLDKGEVKISSARDLRRQLAEIAPMNNEGSQLFCPNGPSSAVSPMMENKCGDRLAIPSVYGRTEDTVGNSIPGFKGGKYTANMPAGAGSASIAADIGGFPAYYNK